ncbi:cell wall-active antibiotic response 4TMS protein YvqF [Tumebacillus sp. BK434]|uniref:cell wall-active antibiotics response protein LiaF n=1 Tax=Tumebacillus sp. BK434 TaxID=2512169 RepID=UPI0010469BA5|nr:cell wall-active antibiotics response protein LiaF [Tumebacillus sp. BK434]TCP56000.1 cell wall-active antibiotic response 4TMS protein YvqF [Tumebacillus sp. BK434]
MNRMLGIILLVTGFIFVVPNFDWWGVRTLSQSFGAFWPLYLIVWALSSVAGSFRRRRRAGWIPLAVIVLGSMLVLDRLQVMDFTSWVLPGLLILFGVMLLFGRRPKGSVRIIRRGQTESYGGEVTEGLDGEISEIRGKMGEVYIGGPDWELKDSVIEQKIGSVRVDLTETVIPLGETVLEVECKMGDVYVLVPEGMAVSVQAICRVGSISLFQQMNNGGGKLHFQSPGYEEAERKVRIRAEVKIGDLNVKRA